MNHIIMKAMLERKADEVHFVDISGFYQDSAPTFTKAVLLIKVLSRKFIIDMYNGVPLTVEEDEFLMKEKMVEELADWLADYLEQKGYNALAQSEQRNRTRGQIESAYINPNLQQGISIVPQKAIARLAGLGFIGKNNLLVTNKYGCAICMCSVLTDAPITTANLPILSSKCGTCDACVQNCPAGAIHGNHWTFAGGRASLVDVAKCSCPLKCMVSCPWTLKYARKAD